MRSCRSLPIKAAVVATTTLTRRALAPTAGAAVARLPAQTQILHHPKSPEMKPTNRGHLRENARVDPTRLPKEQIQHLQEALHLTSQEIAEVGMLV